MPAFFFTLLFLFSLSSFACDGKSEPAQSEYWKKLLHYQTTVLGTKSEVDADQFFLSPEGKSCPEKEFQATIDHAFDSKVYCRFPARYHWLNKLGLTKVDFSQCSEYLSWKDGLSAKGLSLIFASYYPENPASAFGHLFLKINHHEKGELSELDYVVNFSAAAEEDGGIMYALKGLLGGYKGLFTMEKYYQKIQEYEIHEARDLWEFPLQLSQLEVDKVIDHLWELTYSAYFDYYFLDENCSYQVMKLLELAKDESYESNWGPYQIPEENLHQVVERLGLASNEKIRFSLFEQTSARLKRLTAEEKKQFNNVRKGELLDLSALNSSTLDTLHHYYQLKESQNKGQSPEDKKQRFQILRAIAKLPNAPEVEMKKASSPLNGHRSTRLSVGTGLKDSDQFISFKGRPAFHDFMDDDRAYLPNSSLNVLSTDLRYLPKSQKLRLNELVILETRVLAPRSILSTKPSWGVDFSLRTPFDFNCLNCQVGQIKLSRGMSFNFLNDQLVPYLFLHGQIQQLLSKEENIKSFRTGPELELGLMWRPHEKVKNRLAFIEVYNWMAQWTYQGHVIEEQLSYYMNINTSLSLDYRQLIQRNSSELVNRQETSLNFHYYF